MIGGLLSGFLCTGDKVLLRKARDIADVLLPAFEQSPTGLPFRFVVPATGELSGTTNVLAEIGTIIAEFGTLSRLVHDARYYNAAKKALKAVFDRRSPLDLVGTSMDITTGAWISNTSSVNPPHGLAPPRFFHASGGSQVSCPASPGRGTEWKRQTSLPVRASKARGSPGAPGWPSSLEQPRITRSSNTAGAEVGP